MTERLKVQAALVSYDDDPRPLMPAPFLEAFGMVGNDPEDPANVRSFESAGAAAREFVTSLTRRAAAAEETTATLRRALETEVGRRGALQDRSARLRAECTATVPARVNALRIDLIPSAAALLARLERVRVFECGSLGDGPWGGCDGFPHNGDVKWIWSTPGAQSGAAAQRLDVDPPVVFHRTWRTSAADVDVTVHCVVDDSARVYLNDVLIGGAVALSGGWGAGPHAVIRASVPVGTTRMRVEAWNGGGPAGLLLAVVRTDGGGMLVTTDASWRLGP